MLRINRSPTNLWHEVWWRKWNGSLLARVQQSAIPWNKQSEVLQHGSHEVSDLGLYCTYNRLAFIGNTEMVYLIYWSFILTEIMFGYTASNLFMNIPQDITFHLKKITIPKQSHLRYTMLQPNQWFRRTASGFIMEYIWAC